MPLKHSDKYLLNLKLSQVAYYELYLRELLPL